jgi:hypothetical protein
MKKCLKILTFVVIYTCLFLAPFWFPLTSCTDRVDELDGEWVSEDSTTFYHFAGHHLWVGRTSDGKVTNMFALEAKTATDSEIGLTAETIDSCGLRVKIPITIWNNPIGNHYVRSILIGDSEFRQSSYLLPTFDAVKIVKIKDF